MKPGWILLAAIAIMAAAMPSAGSAMRIKSVTREPIGDLTSPPPPTASEFPQIVFSPQTESGGNLGLNFFSPAGGSSLGDLSPSAGGGSFACLNDYLQKALDNPLASYNCPAATGYLQ